MTFEGRFAEQILPEQLHILNVSFLVPALVARLWRLCWQHCLQPRFCWAVNLPMATLGSDGGDYLLRLRGWASARAMSACWPIPIPPRP